MGQATLVGLATSAAVLVAAPACIMRAGDLACAFDFTTAGSKTVLKGNRGNITCNMFSCTYTLLIIRGPQSAADLLTTCSAAACTETQTLAPCANYPSAGWSQNCIWLRYMPLQAYKVRLVYHLVVMQVIETQISVWCQAKLHRQDVSCLCD